MTINGVEVSTFGARQSHITFGHHTYSNESAWIRSSPLPHLENNYIGFKSFEVDLIVKPIAGQQAENARDAINKNISDLLAELLQPAVLELDGFSHSFKGILKSHKVDEMSPRHWHKLTLEFDGYEYGTEITYSGTSSITIVNPGNILSPLLLEIMPTATVNNVTVTGICRNPHTGADMPVTMGKITQNKVIRLDGANGLFTEDGALKSNIDIRVPPAITGGTHTITCSAASASMVATVLPLYM